MVLPFGVKRPGAAGGKIRRPMMPGLGNKSDNIIRNNTRPRNVQSTPAAGPVPSNPGPVAPDIESYLGSDQMYQGGLSSLMRALTQFNSQNDFQRNNMTSAFNTALTRMRGEKDKSLKSLESDFASRGLLNSGLYGKSRDEYNEEFEKRVGDLTFDQNSQQANLGFERQNFEGLNQSEIARLRQEAVARRAAQFNLF